MNWQNQVASAQNFLLALVVAFTLPAFARESADPNFVLSLAKGRKLFAQVIPPSDPSLPTFVLLPGIYRALLASDEGTLNLTKKGFGVVTFNFSTQPHSVAQLEKNETPYFRDHNMTLADLIGEAESAMAAIKKQFGLNQLIPVSLSYTGAVSPGLNGYPLIIETVPMTSAVAVSPGVYQYRSWLKAMWYSLEGIRRALDDAYARELSKDVDRLIKEFNLPKERRKDMIDGYTVLSRAVEDFSWDDKMDTQGTRRVFILARNESRDLLRDQIRNFRNLAAKRADTLLILVEKTGHIIPAEQPELYADILEQIARGKIGTDSQVVTIDPKTKKSVPMRGAQAEQFLKDLVK